MCRLLDIALGQLRVEANRRYPHGTTIVLLRGE